MASQIVLLIVSFVVISKGIPLTSGNECKFEHKYVCGIQDCNCRYVSQTGVSTSSLYRRFIAMFSQDNDDEGQVCDKCDVFCSTVKHINCQHGSCDKQKGCICRDCWSGETCSKYHNNQPEFKELLYVAKINKDTNVDEKILKVSAIDSDMETCVDKYNCPCGRVKYAIDKGNEDGLFYINPASGVISLTRKLDQYDPISFTIVAENEGDFNTVEDNHGDKALATVVITVENDELENVNKRERRSLHHRARRSAVTTYDALEIIFAPVTNETFFAAGCTVNFRLYLAQNSSAAPQSLSNMNIQLSSEKLELGVNGYSVNISNADHSVSLVRVNSDTVSFSIAGPMGTNDYMEIKFHGSVRTTLDPLALLQVAFTMNATGSGPVTYGPKYSNEIYTTYPEIKFARTSVGDVAVESTLDYNVNITMPFFNFTFIFEISTIVNDFRFLSIGNVQLGDVSNSVVAQNKNPTPTIYTGAEDNITSRVVVDFGKITVLNRNQSANTMKLSFSVKVNDHHLLKNASTHWIGVGAGSGEEMLWVGQDAITFSKDEPYVYAEVKALNKTNPTRYRINDVLRFSWIVKHAENASYEGALNVKVLFYFSQSVVWEDNGAESGLTTPRGTKSNSVENGRAVLTYAYEENSKTLLKETTLSGIIAVKVKDTVTPLAELNVEIQIRYQTINSKDRPIRTYKPNPGYLAGIPSFNLTSNTLGRLVNIGQLVEITAKILISKITLEGKFSVILPVRNSSAIMRFVSHESFSDISVGTNINVTSKTESKPTPTFNSTSNDTTFYDRAEIDLGLIKNKALTELALSSADDNTVTFTFKVVLEDNDYVVNQSNYKIGVGVKGSEHMVWISQMIFIANVAVNRRPKLLIEPYSNGSGSLAQGSVVEYNFTISHKNDSDAHAIDMEVVWMLPAYTKYLQVNHNSHKHLSTVKSENNIVFKLSKLDFGETLSVSFSVALDPDKTITKSGKNYAVTPVALTYKTKQQNTLFEPLIPVSVYFIVPEQATPNPPNVVDEFYKRGFLIDNSSSAIYICSLSSKRNKPSCFWTNTKGSTWRAVDVMVISIIGINNADKVVYGVGNNKLSYMKYIPQKGRWYSISRDQWKKESTTLSDNEIVKIEDVDGDEEEPAGAKQKSIENGEKWGAHLYDRENVFERFNQGSGYKIFVIRATQATKTGVYHYTAQNGWKRKALWNCCH